jgi:hypothetical protein
MGAHEVFFAGIPDNSADSRQSSIVSYPNPTCGIFDLQFTVYCLQRISIRIYDLDGREVAAVFEGEMSAGEHTVRFDVSVLPAGIYFYRLTGIPAFAGTGGQRHTGKLVKF